MECDKSKSKMIRSTSLQIKRNTLRIVWKDKVENEAVCEKMGSNTMQSI